MKNFNYLFCLLLTIFMMQACDRHRNPIFPDVRSIKIAAVLPSDKSDLAFSQSMVQSLLTVQDELGESAVGLEFLDKQFDVATAAMRMREYAHQDYDLIVAHGAQYGDSVQAIAMHYPAISFAWGDVNSVVGHDNVSTYSAAAGEGGYVNGVLAALLTINKKIGVTAPVAADEAKAYVTGFQQGVQATDVNVQVLVTWTGSFSDSVLMNAAAKNLINGGADVLTGTSQAAAGAIAAVVELGNVLWLGNQADQSSLAPAQVVACQVYDWSDMLTDIINKIREGHGGGEFYRLNLKNGGLRIVYNAGYNLPVAVKDAAEAAIDAIKDGTIQIQP